LKRTPPHASPALAVHHPDAGDALHEMLIVHARGTTSAPRQRLGKSESLHMIEGSWTWCSSTTTAIMT